MKYTVFTSAGLGQQRSGAALLDGKAASSITVRATSFVKTVYAHAAVIIVLASE
jgi:hypothetical protein